MADTLTAALAYIQHIVDHDHRLYCREGACVATCVNGRAVLSAQPPKSVEWFKERMREQVAFDDAQVNPYAESIVAATQEQPAGSEASELKVGDPVRVSGMLESISTDGTLIKVNFGMGEYCHPNRLLVHPAPGSPRKVGEEAPFAYVCPANCGCMWRDNRDGTMSLFGKNSQSCSACEPLGLAELIPVYAARPSSVPVGEQKEYSQ